MTNRFRATARKAEVGVPARVSHWRWIFVVVFLMAACGGKSGAAPAPGQPRGMVPDLSGSKVLLYPVQRVLGVSGDVDSEIAFAMDGAETGPEWIGPVDLRESLRRSPNVEIRVDALPVDAFLAAEVLRIGDPMFGFIRRMAVLHDARFAVIPVAARYRPATEQIPEAVELVAVLIEVSTGRVLWHAIADGPGGAADPAALAAAAQELARWFR